MSAPWITLSTLCVGCQTDGLYVGQEGVRKVRTIKCCPRDCLPNPPIFTMSRLFISLLLSYLNDDNYKKNNNKNNNNRVRGNRATQEESQMTGNSRKERIILYMYSFWTS